MSDPTLARLDDESWNQTTATSPRDSVQAAEKLRNGAGSVQEMRSIYQRVLLNIPILDATGQRARFVYGGLSLPAPGSCADCGDGPVTVTDRQEWEWTGELKYVPRRMFDLCEDCADALDRLPLGQRWQRARSKRAVLARCIRSLEAVGHTAAVEALRRLP